MIGRLRGTLLNKQPPTLLIEVGGVGYDVEAPLSTFAILPAVNQEAILHTHLAVREDAQVLYGFATLGERDLFRDLIKVSGIGAKLALTILSGASGEELARYVVERDAAALTRLPGIGKKTAERIIIELRDKLDDLPAGGASVAGGATPAVGSALGEATNALIALGYKPQEAGRMARNVAKPDMSVEEIIRLALQTMVKPT